MKQSLFLLFPLLLNADSLKSLLEFATHNNELISSKSIHKNAKRSEVKSSESDYYPTIDVGGFYQRSDDPNPIMPGTTYSGYAKVGFDVYSGGKKSYTLKQKKDEFSASGHDYEATRKNIQLSIVQDFYHIKTLEASLMARVGASNAVLAQLQRMQKFYDAELATSDDVDRLQSAYDTNIYAIDSIKFEIYSLKKNIELKVGKGIASFDKSTFTKIDTIEFTELDAIKSLKSTKSSIINASETIDSYYYPQIRVEDTYSLYGYQDEPSVSIMEQVDNQNVLMASINLRLFDFSKLSEQKEAVRLSADALNEQITYQAKEQKMNQELSVRRIETAKLNIRTAKSALKAGTNALNTITQKYSSGIVDNVTYLDALSSQTEAKSTYESSLNNLELSYALYYFYNAQNLEEFLND
ncbi:MAG: TolC family protein [Epsilonproteobacteria bacterium]|nr:MAG: TolC family protein [Campylobacterota bacterium]